jgi:hypothetical protein
VHQHVRVEHEDAPLIARARSLGFGKSAFRHFGFGCSVNDWKD